MKDSNGIIKVTDQNFDQLSKGVIDYYNVLYITTSKGNKQGLLCEMCNDFESTYRKVSLATQKQAPDAKVFFFEVDVSQNRKLIKELGLTTIPHVLIFPPPDKDVGTFRWSKSAFYQYEMTPQAVKEPLHFADFLAKVLKIYIQINQDFEYQEFATYFIAFVIIFSLFKRKVLPKISNKAKFFCIILSFGILMPSITGYKFTQMNSIPFIARDPQGNIMYFSGGMGWQFGIEVFTVSLMYIAMGSMTIGLIYLSYSTSDDRRKNSMILAVSCILCYTFSYFLSCFKIKNPEYPYSF